MSSGLRRQGAAPSAVPHGLPIQPRPPANNMPPPSGLTNGSRELWLLQHAHRLAIHDPNEKHAQAIMLNQFWSRLVNNHRLEAAHSHLQKVHSQLIASSIQKDNLIESLRSQVAQGPKERDLAQTLERLSGMIVTLMRQTTEDSQQAIQEAGKDLMHHQIAFTRAEHAREALHQQLNASRNELNRVQRRMEELRAENETVLIDKERRIKELSTLVEELRGQISVQDRSILPSRSLKRRRCN